MTDHKFTDDDVIKALECLSGAEIFCRECAFGRLEDHGFACKKNVANAALALINRQKAEVAEYQKHIDNDIIYVNRVKAEAIKEFAERLKANMSNIARMEYGGNTYFCVGYDLIDNLVKEMTEESK